VSVVCLVEQDSDGPVDSSLRALTFARSIAGSPTWLGSAAATASAPSAAGVPVIAVVFGRAAASPLAAYGATGACEVELPAYAPVAWARTLKQVADAHDATAVLAAGTDHGAEVMAHLGALTGLPVAANCFELSPSGPGTWRFRRQRWGGSLLETGSLEGSPALLSVAADAVPPVALDDPSALEVESFVPELAESDLAVRAIQSRDSASGVSLANARVVVSGGRGVGGPDGYAVLEELAGLLGGAVGVSRVATSLGWRPHSQQVGQTGTRVSPELYLACGISGAIQHLAGCQSSKTMIAVNTDPAAAIMGRADYAVIGDLHEVLPALVEALKARAAARS
jgi:electron transfer flavoprotein alpha subunit